MSIRALHVTLDGGVCRVELQASASGGHLGAMYREIGCALVDCVGLRYDLDIWLDDEGKLHDPWIVNPGATALVGRHGIRDLVAGTVLLTGGADEDGNTLGISDETAGEMRRLLGGGG